MVSSTNSQVSITIPACAALPSCSIRMSSETHHLCAVTFSDMEKRLKRLVVWNDSDMPVGTRVNSHTLHVAMFPCHTPLVFVFRLTLGDTASIW